MTQSYVMTFLEQANRCTTLPELEQVWMKTIADIGFDFGSFVSVGSNGFLSPDSIMSSNCPLDWSTHYICEKLYENDPFVSKLSQYNSPVLWTDIYNSKDHSDAERNVLNLSSDYSLKKGLAIPLVGTTGHECFMTVTTKINSDEVDKLGIAHQDALLSIGYIYQTMGKALQGAGFKGDTRRKFLTNRERECILWSARGKSAWEVGGILNLSERTVIFHLNNAKKKLRATSKAHLVTKAVSGGFVDI